MNKIPVLKIRDGNGNFIPINALRGEKGKDGVNGKSAYEQAKEGGYNGTEEEFISLLNGLINTDNGDTAHYTDFSNPHQVTAQQVGALPITGGQLQGGLGLKGEGDANTSEIVQNSDFATIFRNKAGGIETILSLTNESKVDVADVLKLWFANGNGYSIYGEHNKPTASDVGAIPEAYYASNDLNTELQQGGNKMTVCNYHSGTLNTPYKERLTVYAHGMVITNANSNQYGTQLCMPSGEDAIYVRRLNVQSISKWVKMADNERVIPIEKGGTGANNAEAALKKLGASQVEHISYEGTGLSGADNAIALSFNFAPKFILWSARVEKSTGEVKTFNQIVDMSIVTTEYSRYCGFCETYSYGASTNDLQSLYGKKSPTGETFSWYSTQNYSQMNNREGYSYHYIALG